MHVRSYAVTTVSIAKQMHKPTDDMAHPVVSHLAQLFSGDRKQLCVASGPFRRLLSAADCATTNIDITSPRVLVNIFATCKQYTQCTVSQTRSYVT